MIVALYGGSFDPPHLGHEKVIKEALKTLHVDKLLVMPTWLSPFKSSSTLAPPQRLELVKCAWGELPHVEILDFEIEQKKAVTTYESVLHVREVYNPKKIYLIMGNDSYLQLHSWANSKKLLQLVEVVVASRDGEAPKRLKSLDINVNISSSKLRENLDTMLIPENIRKEVAYYYKQGIKCNKELEK